MGVKGLYKFLSSYKPNPRVLEDYAGKAIGIDVSQCAYAWQLAAKMTHNNRPTSFLNGILHLTMEMQRANVEPVYVFDGPAPSLKADVLAARREHREFSFDQQASADCQSLLSLLGCAYIVAAGEADATLAALCSSGYVHAVMSDDSDMLAYGATRVWRRRHNAEYVLSDILASLELTMEQFVKVCITLGTDYGNPIAGVGPKRAVATVRAGLDKYTGWQEIYALYTAHVPVDKPEPLERDTAGVVAFLSRHGFDPARVRRILS
jgi:flap endonuclease-1